MEHGLEISVADESIAVFVYHCKQVSCFLDLGMLAVSATMDDCNVTWLSNWESTGVAVCGREAADCPVSSSLHLIVTLPSSLLCLPGLLIRPVAIKIHFFTVKFTLKMPHDYIST